MKRNKMSVKRNLQQPVQNLEYPSSTDDKDVGQDFGSLINMPLSKGGHFVFKSEKDWSAVDFSSEYSEFFTLNLNTLSVALDSIPFNDYVDVDDKYFTSDQLTSICNKAEESKIAYNYIFNTMKASNSLNTALTENETKWNENTRTERLESLENARSLSEGGLNDLEDVDFLLSLDKPIERNLPKITRAFNMSSASMCSNNDSRSKNIPAKPLDLEKWLDSVLDD